MKIVCIGGGPAGLYFGLLMKMRNPAHDITVVERNKPYDTFGRRSTTGTTLSWSSKAKSSARAATASSVSAARNC